MGVSISISEILVAVLTFVAAGFGYIIKEQRDKIKTIQDQLADKKYLLYNEIFSVFFDLIKGQKGIGKTREKDLAARLIDIKKDLFIYGPDLIVTKFIEWNRYVSNNQGDIKHAQIYLELFVLIRKDMGHVKTRITESDILRAIMTTDEEYIIMNESIKR
jgi:hypothetical protein